jgi:hypothetical protein
MCRIDTSLCAVLHRICVYGFLHIKGHVRVEKTLTLVRDSVCVVDFPTYRDFCTFSLRIILKSKGEM